MSEPESIGRQRINFGSTVRGKGLPGIVESPFPDRRTIHWVPPDLAMTDGFSIVITSEVLLQISRHVEQTLNYETGGFLLGNRRRCPNTAREYITIDQYVEAKFTKPTNVSLTFTHETWGDLDDELTGKYYGKKLLGWYHSHPRMSIFLSEDDLRIHRERFVETWMVALVLEPEKQLGGFFSWSNGKIDPNRYVNFYELLSGGVRESVIAWKNYDGVDPLQSAPPILSAINTRSAPAPDNVPTGAESMPVHRRPLPVGLPGNLSWFRTAALALSVLIVSGVLGFLGMKRWGYINIANVNENPVPTPSPIRRPSPGPTLEPSPSPTPSVENKPPKAPNKGPGSPAKQKQNGGSKTVNSPGRKVNNSEKQPKQAKETLEEQINSIRAKIVQREDERENLDEKRDRSRIQRLNVQITVLYGKLGPLERRWNKVKDPR